MQNSYPIQLGQLRQSLSSFKDIKTGEIFRYWVDGQEHVPHFFDYERTLLISFQATAEHGVFQQLSWKTKIYVGLLCRELMFIQTIL